MKRAFYSIIIIMYSIFTIAVMIIYGYKDKSIDEMTAEYKTANEEAGESEENSDLLKEDNLNKDVYKQKDDAEDNTVVNGEDETNKNAEDEAVQINGENKYGSNGEKMKSAEIIDRGEGELYSQDIEIVDGVKANEAEEEKDGPILKIPAKEIPGKMSLGDKMVLLSYSKKLSSGDYAKIISYIKNYTPRYAIKNTFYILDDKLSDEEIEEIKEILSEYINFSNV